MNHYAADPIVVIGAGQSGLAAAHTLQEAGMPTVVLEAGDRPVGSWPDYYDSLTLFSPARYSELPGTAFPGDPEHYPTRDETVAYLERYAAGLDVEIRTESRVVGVEGHGRGFLVHPETGPPVSASGVVAATGSFSNPHLPALPGQAGFSGELLHVASYREPKEFAGQRIIVVGGGNSAIQIAHELADHATVTLATLDPVQFLPQRPGGRDIHYWTHATGFDQLPPEWLAQLVSGPLVSDDGNYSQALNTGKYDRRPMFAALDTHAAIWADGTRDPVDAVILATGYRPSLDYLADLGALDDHGHPRHSGGISTTHPGLVYLGLEFQRSFASNTLRGVGTDAAYVIPPLLAYARNAPELIGA